MAKKKSKQVPQNDEHTIPGPVSPEALNISTIKKKRYQELAITEYVEWQMPDEEVQFLEKITTEQLYETRYDVWNVHTDKRRYWVITNPTNLYSQELFPSLDYTLSFHIGVTTRMMADRQAPVEDRQDPLIIPLRRLAQASDALDEADEAEEFQAVGMRCRECLISLVKAIGTASMIPSGQEAPKVADFIHWSELIANSIAHGSSAEEIRGYLKSISKSTWQLVNWLTHATNAVRFDGYLSVMATENVLNTYGLALVRHKRGIPDRCPKCSSYKINSVYRPDLEIDPQYVTTCESCGWMDIPEDTVSIEQENA